MSRFIYLVLIILIITDCRDKSVNIHKDKNPVSLKRKQIPVNYAAGFDMEYYDDYTLLTVKDPWQKAENISFKYALVDTPVVGHKKSPEYRYIQTPVNRVVCLSTTHIGFIDLLDATESIAGISGKQYITNSNIIQRIEKGEVKDVGYGNNLRYEIIIDLEPDIVFVYGVTGSISAHVNKLRELNINAVIIAEYLEDTPLAKMEWIKFIAAFFNLEEQAVIKFDSVVYRYNNLISLTRNINDKPKILLGLPWRGTWYISGGKSYIARLIKDAGGDYLWNSMDYRDSQPVSLEAVFEKAFMADFWLNPGSVNNIDEILALDNRFKDLPAIRDKKVFNNNNKLNKFGGNEYYETGVVEPDVILADIIHILHPGILPDHSLKYYKKTD
jgi:iron complex transport system substrate-binding protein